MKEITETFEIVFNLNVSNDDEKTQLPSFNLLPAKEFVEFLAALKKLVAKSEAQKKNFIQFITQNNSRTNFYVFVVIFSLYCLN